MSHIYAKMTPEQQREVDERDLGILRMRDSRVPQKEIAAHFGIAVSTVNKVIMGITRESS